MHCGCGQMVALNHAVLLPRLPNWQPFRAKNLQSRRVAVGKPSLEKGQDTKFRFELKTKIAALECKARGSLRGHTIGVDLGNAKTGLSVSLGGYAPRPWTVVRQRGDKLLETILQVGQREKADEFVVGLPKAWDGKDTEQAAPSSGGISSSSEKKEESSDDEAGRGGERINWREAWKLADGPSSQNHWRLRRGERPPLSDDGARRVIKERELYERALRRTGVPEDNIPRKWIRRTPQQMKEYLADSKWQWRWKRRYSRTVEGAIAAVRQTSSLPPDDVDMRQVMKPFMKELGFRDMCVILKEQRGWRQAQSFFSWMKLQIPYSPSVIAYTILLGIYGQAGKLTLLEDTLTEMLDAGVEPDEVAAGCMLEAYARWERYDTMLDFYAAMRERGLVPSPHVYRTMIVTLYRRGRLADVVTLWEDFLVEKLEANFALFAVVIHVYNKEGLLPEAVATFETMRHAGHTPDELLYNTVISSLGKLNRFEEAERLFNDMKKQGLSPSKYTYTTMINVWSRAGRFSNAAEMLSEMQRAGCVPDEVVYCSIINMYGKCKLYEEAERIFQEMTPSHEKTYTSMAKVRADAGRHEEALQLFDVMAEKGLLTTRMAWNTLLHCLVGVGDVQQATKVYSDMVEVGSANVVTYGNMINLYSKFQMVAEAEDLLAEMQEAGVRPDAFIYGSFVKLYCNCGMVDRAAEVVQEITDYGLVPDQIVTTNLIQAYGKAGRYDKAEQLFRTLHDPDAVAVSSMLALEDTVGKEDVPSSQELDDPVVLNQLLIRRAESGDLREAELVFEKLVEAGGRIDDTAAAVMINLYGRRGLFPKAKSLFTSLQQNESPPSLYVHNTMLKTCVACKELDEALSIFDTMEGASPLFDAVTVSILVHGCTKAGRYTNAAALMKKARKAGVVLDTVAYNTMLKANLKSGNFKGALDLYTEMQELHVKPSIQTYTILISVFSKLGDLQKAEQAFEVLYTSEAGADEIAYSQMIHCYGSAGRPEEAAGLFRDMERKGFNPNEVIYNNLLDAYARSGLFTEARLLLGDMRRSNCPPTCVTYLLLISAYSAHSEATEAEALLDLMQEHGVLPDHRHYNEVLRAHGKAGHLEEARRVFSDMKVAAPELGCFRTLLKMHLDQGEFEVGWGVWREMSGKFRLDQNVYCVAVDLCVGAGKRGEAEQLKVEMKEKGFVYKGKHQGALSRSVWRKPKRQGSDVTSVTELSVST